MKIFKVLVFFTFLSLLLTACPLIELDPVVTIPVVEKHPITDEESFSYLEKFCGDVSSNGAEGVPAAPDNLTVLPHRTGAKLFWNDNSQNEDTFYIYVGLPGARPALKPYNSDTCHLSIDLLLPNVQYQVWISAHNIYGNSEEQTILFTTAGENVSSGFPDPSIAWNHDNDLFNLNWDVVPGAEEYWVFLDVSMDEGIGVRDKYLLEKTTSTSVSYDLSSINCNYYCYIEVFPVNSFGTAGSGYAEMCYPVHPDFYDRAYDDIIPELELNPTSELQVSPRLTLCSTTYDFESDSYSEDWVDNFSINLEVDKHYNISLYSESCWYRLRLYSKSDRKVVQSNTSDLTFTAPYTGEYRLSIDGDVMEYHIAYRSVITVPFFSYIDLDVVSIGPEGISLLMDYIPEATKYRVYRKDSADQKVSDCSVFKESKDYSFTFTPEELDAGVKNFFQPAIIDAHGALRLQGNSVLSLFFMPHDEYEPDDDSSSAVTFLATEEMQTVKRSVHADFPDDWTKMSVAAGMSLSFSTDIESGSSNAGKLNFEIYDASLLKLHEFVAVNHGSYSFTFPSDGDYFIHTYSNFSDGSLQYTYGLSYRVLSAEVIAPPSVLTAISDSVGLVLDWDDCGDAVSYNIYKRADSSDMLKIGSSIESSFIDDMARLNETNFYCITAINAAGKEGVRSGEKSFSYFYLDLIPVITFTDFIQTESGLQGDSGHCYFSTSLTTGSVYYLDVPSGKELQVLDQSNLSIITRFRTYPTRYTASSDRNVIFKIISAGDKIELNYSFVDPALASSLKAVYNPADGITVDWGTVLDAESYNVYRYNEITSDYILLANTLTNTYLDSNPVPGVNNMYQVTYIKSGKEGPPFKIACFVMDVASLPELFPSSVVQTVGISLLDGECDYYRISLIAGKTYQFTTVSGFNEDSYGILFNDSLDQLTYDDDAGEGYNFMINYAPVSDMVVLLEVSGFSMDPFSGILQYVSSP